jgi:lipid II:glycine glycyltransferase (peptidoglycan interpeptide bridge formation enzyme)
LYHYKTRNAIRKAIKSGVKVQHEGSMIALEKLAALHHDNMNKIRGLSKPYKVFKSIYECFSYDKDYRVYIATKDGIEVAILLVFFFNKTAEYFIPATKLEYREFQPMSLMIFKAMQEAVKRNLLYWNWGGTWISQKGVYNFKKRWGTRDYPYYYYVKVYDDNLLSRNHQELVAQYPFYYTVPFNKLKE